MIKVMPHSRKDVGWWMFAIVMALSIASMGVLMAVSRACAPLLSRTGKARGGEDDVRH